MRISTCRKVALLCLLIFAGSVQSFAQLTVDDSVTPTDMVSAITGGGIVFSNVSFIGENPSRGTFSCSGPCNLGIGSGIILSSGFANSIIGPNSSPSTTYSFGGIGNDMDLFNIAGTSFFDAAILQFDFITVSDSAVFNFRFGSEEYNEFVNSQFNDVFAFFISGPGFSGNQNIALIPGTSIPVAINNVNNGYTPSSVISTGPCQNCLYYEDNTAGLLTTQYDGMTTILTAVAANLVPGEIYHLKIAIADVSDGAYDSGVIIEAGSFTTPNPAWIYADGQRITSGTLHICQDSTVILSAPPGFTYLWSDGSTGQSIDVSTEGTYSVQITGSNPADPVTSSPIQVVVDAVCEATTTSGNHALTNTVSFYPNPLTNSSTLIFDNSSNEKFTLSFFDVTGRVVMQQTIAGSEAAIDRNQLASGIYSYRLSNADATKSVNGKIAIR